MIYHPTNNKGTISSRYGWRGAIFHAGVDIAVATGTPIYAIENGIIHKANRGCVEGYFDCGGGFGNYVVIDHLNDFYTNYGHLSELNVKIGQVVKKGELIGYVGNTGHSTGSHLHFEVRQGGWLAPTHFDPMLYLTGQKEFQNLPTLRLYKQNTWKYALIALGVGLVGFSAYKIIKP